ncbi:MAG: aspartate carbamoyltransferase regulatory subunit [Candidatus Thalassarchaeaceae archaeon]|jgi:aspartate carbamoyltransferase regulatory subunit|nr:aspartate carbamoyltransferase regulatory subunit [Euryarchaeota archaeon]MDP6220286.1 aspartate carbamoyltransferase regulatory subunit [Candidatus Thalassarchaeaceae archaeon]MBV43606.1 aspartate carbamoyltransferase regulatory subunit [Euryarchaeota archaeon]MDP7091583.1 aspartate carbamoyltransferase regulatory subunit [Candidatus Thalassarchaeaceae archaeon]MDP7257703.1 aspartate carbamoyltransferase regulatory subunit [Candidatus Thalassarchaeaceae archaeon]|tara:strand:- start:3011 stop:3478 length:468 start_codon:yes stop_codon:yes gene_type:complete
MAEMRRVTAIRNGTVIDHIPAGHALQVIQMLHIDMTRSTPVSLVMNVPSDKLGRKDVLKIEDRELNQEQLDRLALIAPAASIAIIRNHALAEKLRVELADDMVNVARCSFSNCITKNAREPLPQRLSVISQDPLEVRCYYCGRGQDLEEVINNII